MPPYYRFPSRCSISKLSSWSWSWSKPPYTDFSVVQPEAQKKKRFRVRDIPKSVPRPSYANCKRGIVDPVLIPERPVIWSEQEIIGIRESCQLARKVLEEVKAEVAVGVDTEHLDEIARELCFIHNAYPSPLNFNSYPKSISTSVNNVAAHGIPDSRCLVSGDILNIDVTVFLNGFHGDCSDTVTVGEVDQHALKLIRVTEECVNLAVSACRPGEYFRKIGTIIHRHARSEDCTTVPIFLGHGIGDFFHGPPSIYHCPNNYPGRMLPGMVFTIEPVICEGDRRVRILEDGWTAVTMDNSRTAQKEHTLLITQSGVDILTA